MGHGSAQSVAKGLPGSSDCSLDLSGQFFKKILLGAVDLADDPARPACCKTPWSIVLVRQEAVWGCFGEFGHVCRLHGMF